MANNWYVTREEVHEAMDSKDSAGHMKKIDSAISSASRMIDGLTRRKFYPETKTKYFDYPDNSPSYRLWFDSQDNLVSATAVVSGGVTIAANDYFLSPYNDGPPYNMMELDLSSDSFFDVLQTNQRQIAITGTWGYGYETAACTTITADINSSVTSVNLKNSAAFGIGSLLKIGDELIEVTDKSMLDTGENTSALTAASTARTITGITAGSVFAGEVILIDAERMRVIDVAGTTLIVDRAIDGSVLAVHSVGADIYALRTATVSRGVLGTSAAAHVNADSVLKFVYPSDIVELCLAEAVNTVQQRSAGYGRTIGSGEFLREAKGAALAQMRNAVLTKYAEYKTA